MNSMILVNQATIDRTAGWGNTQDSYNRTTNQIADNDLCDADLRTILLAVLSARFVAELATALGRAAWGTVTSKLYGQENRPATNDDRNVALTDVLISWANAAGKYDDGHRRVFTTLSGVTYGMTPEQIADVNRAAKWITVLVEKMPGAKGKRKAKKKAA